MAIKFDDKKPSNPRSLLWVILVLLLAICIWLIFRSLSPAKPTDFGVDSEINTELTD